MRKNSRGGDTQVESDNQHTPTDVVARVRAFVQSFSSL
jgi:hypothetical protein